MYLAVILLLDFLVDDTPEMEITIINLNLRRDLLEKFIMFFHILRRGIT